MKKSNLEIQNTLNKDRVTCDYADIYFEDPTEEPESLREKDIIKAFSDDKTDKEEWVSPSDLLIGIIELNPPFTSKITRGKTQEGILAIGNNLLDIEHEKFLKSLTILLHDNDASWNFVLKFQRREVMTKVKTIYQNIFKRKSAVMQREITHFYQNTLQELENHLRSEIRDIIQTAHADIISKMNTEIQLKLEKERKVLENVLRKKYVTEVEKVQKYYHLLLHNEICRNDKLIRKAIHDRNDALKAFYRNIEAKLITTTMYVMSLERKKCRMKQLILENIQTSELTEKLQKVKEREDVIEAFQHKDERISDINRQWEENIQKILRLFLKFLSFSLKLLPEQTTFLLDFEKMVILQLNEIKKNPYTKSSIMIDEDDEEKNIFKFEKQPPEEEVCSKEPFVLVGDLSDPVPRQFGSRETIPSDVDLPYFTADRKYIYAKCHGYEDIKAFLRTQICLCDIIEKESSEIPTVSILKPASPKSSVSVIKSESSNESFIGNDISRLEECPVRKCGDWSKKNTFPYLPSYVEYTEENFKRVTAILGEPSKIDSLPQRINEKEIARQELPFSKTKEKHHTVETQYSSQENISINEVNCSCADEPHLRTSRRDQVPSKQKLNEILTKRQRSLDQLIRNNPNLLRIFTDECFDYKL